ncbi:MAG: DNA translocase FtsK [Lachnospiraceae bacterium]|nr:DNA translocase FtsK [Lachnospiraceae bacterium]
MAERRNKKKQTPSGYTVKDEIASIVIFALMVYLFLCNFGIGGSVGNVLSGILFGLFGLRAYIAPVALLALTLFLISNASSRAAIAKAVSGAVLFLLLGIVIDLVARRLDDGRSFFELFRDCADIRGGGGLIAGFLGRLSYRYLSLTGTLLLLVVLAMICIVILTNRSLTRMLKDGSRDMVRHAGEDLRARRARREQERERLLAEEEERLLAEAESRRDAEKTEETKRARSDKKKSGVTSDTDLRADDRGADVSMNSHVEPEVPEYGKRKREKADAYDAAEVGDELHEIVYDGSAFADDYADDPDPYVAEDAGFEGPAPVKQHASGIIRMSEGTETFTMPKTQDAVAKARVRRPAKQTGAVETAKNAAVAAQADSAVRKTGKAYQFPPMNLLARGEKKKSAGGSAELKETAAKLEKILETFGVNAKVVDFSRGPAVTRYELQPEVGVKVSRILNLADDIKLNLAATDIRIEAPIPGKVAVGIEVPNTENVTVTLRELLESEGYRSAESRLTFAVGKDIAGETVVTDIAKMPHLLIAGATGSGKSVCINTLVLSLLYKAHPDDVKLIMVDPKVVELNMYNGIPHLLIPVVTDPKKAAGALNWAVAEMEKRYRMFADAEVRDLAGYNKYVELHGEDDTLKKLPQIVLIVDELADLMMVSKSEVETAICRLAQLARAAGIHLIIATQRPSVDVITGLIKANMPSRIAFAVSSGVDSRTILDMNGAEKLLGKGDMLFFPQNYSKPVRVQGAFVSDREIQGVCDFLKRQTDGTYSEQTMAEIEKNVQAAAPASGTAQAGAGRDEYFEEAGRFIIGKEKASIGNLQRVFKIGFNRAARIMDQLCEAGVVGEEAGTKPREILMTMEQFEEIL